MPEENTEIKRKTTNKEVEKFLALGIRDYGKAIGHWSLKPLKESTKPLGTEPLMIAKSLFTDIEIEDSNINERVTEILKEPEKMTMDGAALLTAVFVGKAEAKNKGFLTPKEKKDLSKLTDTVINGALDKIAGTKRKAMRWTTAFAVLVTGCIATAESTIELTPTGPVATEVAAIPTASPEVVNSFNESAQRLIDEVFEGLGIHSVSLVGAGILKNSSGDEFALFTSKLPDSVNDEDLDFLIIGGINGNNQIETVKGLVIDETKAQGPILEFIAVTFNLETQTFVFEGSYIRTNTETGEIEVYQDGAWQALNGPDETIDDVQTKLGGGVLAAPALPTPTAPSPVEWDFSQELPEIHSENTRFEAGEDGTDRIIFTHEESEYIVEITKPDLAIDIDGVEITEGILKVKFFSKPDEEIRAKDPIIAYTDINTNEPLAWHDIKTNEWIYRYETLWEHQGEYPPTPSWLTWIPDEGGVVGCLEMEDDAVDYYVKISGRPVRVFIERIPNPGDFVGQNWVEGKSGEFEDLIWVTMTYGEENKIIDVLIYGSKQSSSSDIGIFEDTADYQKWVVSDDEHYSLEELVTAISQSPFVEVLVGYLHPLPSNILLGINNRLDFSPLSEELRDVYLHLQYPEKRRLLLEGLKNEELEIIPDRVKVGYQNFWILK